MNSKQTKIVCTIGPASENYETILKMAQEGMNIVRLNFSHGSHEEHGNRIKLESGQSWYHVRYKGSGDPTW